MAQRVGISALRQVAAKQNTFFSQNLPRLALAAARPAGVLQTRPASTSKLTETDAQSLLAAQRRHRPVSPNLGIYDFSQTWLNGSIWNRFTGGLMSGGLYVFSMAYLAAPLLGWHLESASLAAAFGALPLAAKAGAKFLVAWPFVFHLYNAARHLVWDTTTGIAKATIRVSGWAVWGTSLVTSLGLAFYW